MLQRVRSTVYPPVGTVWCTQHPHAPKTSDRELDKEAPRAIPPFGVTPGPHSLKEYMTEEPSLDGQEILPDLTLIFDGPERFGILEILNTGKQDTSTDCIQSVRAQHAHCALLPVVPNDQIQSVPIEWA